MNFAVTFILGSVAIVAVGAMLYFGVRLGRAIEKNAPTEMRATLTSTGVVLYGCMTAVLVIFAAAPTLEPEGPLGSFLRRPEGVVAALVGTVVFFSLAAWLFEKIGYPILRRRENE